MESRPRGRAVCVLYGPIFVKSRWQHTLMQLRRFQSQSVCKYAFICSAPAEEESPRVVGSNWKLTFSCTGSGEVAQLGQEVGCFHPFPSPN
ncbi:hypothetical protein CEXT_247301 [Caerostris extrusa]|uniref:Uncharacterized protein n=1 Tax=Caerostris extrusa TaxID=172846 RepID=A0AAV4MFQ9_CAEEX|nr:hypothetical protein CEXT_247301 [Caerostris extrusa]